MKITLFDSKKWNGPKTLHRTMSIQDPDILKCVADCKLNLTEPAVMNADDLDRFHSNLRSG